jgi:integrase
MAIKIKLREKIISGNRKTLYLDIYPAITDPETGKETRRKFLNMYLFTEIEYSMQKYIDKNGKENETYKPVLNNKGNPKTIKLSPLHKKHNEETLELAQQIMRKEENHLNKPEIYTSYEKEQLRIKERGEQNFVTYFKSLADKRKASNHDNWVSAYNYLEAFTKGRLRFADLNQKFCDDFKEYLLSNKSKRIDKTQLAKNTAASYFNKFKASLNQAYKEEYLNTDLNAKIACTEPEEVMKQTLTIEELNLLAKAECKYPLMKNYVLFSASTGMPFKEMQNLCWSNIEVSERFGIRVKMIRQKTKKIYVLNISEQAYKLLGERKETSDKVFESLNDRDRYYNFQLWLAQVGIKKKMTFHDLRHSYACLQIDSGTDLYTLQGNMGHSTPQQSMAYGKVSDSRKREAANKIQLDI